MRYSPNKRKGGRYYDSLRIRNVQSGGPLNLLLCGLRSRLLTQANIRLRRWYERERRRICNRIVLGYALMRIVNPLQASMAEAIFSRLASSYVTARCSWLVAADRLCAIIRSCGGERLGDKKAR